MEGKGDDVLLKTTRVTEWTWNHGGYIAVLFGAFLLAGCMTAYVIAVARGNVDPFLPLISDAAGSPPQNGLFGTLICIGGMLGVIFMFLRYMIVLEKNREQSKLVTLLNKFSLGVGLASMFGITLITGYPLNFYRNKDAWLLDVGIPHMIGGVMLFSMGLIYIAVQSLLTLLLNAKDRSLFFSRVGICIICAITFIFHLITVPDNFRGVSTFYFLNETGDVSKNTTLLAYPKTMGSSLKLPIDTTGSYISSAITEWLLVIFFCCFFFTFFNEAQQYSLLIVIETHNCPSDHLNDVSTEPNGIKKQNGTNATKTEAYASGQQRRQSDVRTYLRRDSTCQTIPDSADDPATKPTFTSFNNEKMKKKPSQQLDMFAGDKLQKFIESKMKKSKPEDKKNDPEEDNQEKSAETNNIKEPVLKSEANGLAPSNEETERESEKIKVEENQSNESHHKTIDTSENILNNDIETKTETKTETTNDTDK